MHIANKKDEKCKFGIVHDKQIKHSAKSGFPKNITNVLNAKKTFNLPIAVNLVQPVIKIQILNIEQEEKATAGTFNSVVRGRKG